MPVAMLFSGWQKTTLQWCVAEAMYSGQQAVLQAVQLGQRAEVRALFLQGWAVL